MLTETGSKISKPGDLIEAVLLAAVVQEGRVVLPSGLHLRGRILRAESLGYGFKHQTAKLAYQIDRLVLPDGSEQPIHTRLKAVDTAKEKVDVNGVIYGIRPTFNVSSSLAAYAWRLALLEPMIALPIWGAKVLFARSPDPEIYFPLGTELILELTEPADVAALGDLGFPVEPLSRADLKSIKSALTDTPSHRAVEGNGRQSDRINLVFIATPDELLRAFDGAGWDGADKRSFKSIIRTYRSVIERSAYRRAPFNRLQLNGRDPEMVFQKSLNTFAKRHHGRVWRGPMLENGQSVWLMAATEDTGIHFKLKTLRFGHEIDHETENERTKIVNDLVFTNCVAAAGMVNPQKHFGLDESAASPRLAILRLNECREAKGGAQLAAAKTRQSSRMPGFWKSLHNEVVRSNVAFLGFNTSKLATATKGLFAKRPASTPRGSDMGQQQNAWFESTSASYTDVLSVTSPQAEQPDRD